MPSFNAERAATILLDAAFSTDEKAAKKWSVTPQTVCAYRKRLFTDNHFLRLFNLKKAEFESGWASELSAAIRAGGQFLKEAAEKCDPTDVKAIRAVAGAIQICSQAVLTSKVLDARHAGSNPGDRAAIDQMDSADSAVQYPN